MAKVKTAIRASVDITAALRALPGHLRGTFKASALDQGGGVTLTYLELDRVAESVYAARQALERAGFDPFVMGGRELHVAMPEAVPMLCTDAPKSDRRAA
jgi:hypothetical protein